jgi:hypothetical protein
MYQKGEVKEGLRSAGPTPFLKETGYPPNRKKERKKKKKEEDSQLFSVETSNIYLTSC